MEEVIDQLRELNEPVPVPLELPEEETLVEIQEQILIHLPFELREYLLKVSDVVYGRLEPVTASDWRSCWRARARRRCRRTGSSPAACWSSSPRWAST